MARDPSARRGRAAQAYRLASALAPASRARGLEALRDLEGPLPDRVVELLLDDDVALRSLVRHRDTLELVIAVAAKAPPRLRRRPTRARRGVLEILERNDWTRSSVRRWDLVM